MLTGMDGSDLKKGCYDKKLHFIMPSQMKPSVLQNFTVFFPFPVLSA
jgi:hypothetical protein